MKRQTRRPTRLALLILPVLWLAACDTLLAPRLLPPEPCVRTRPIADPGEQSPLYPKN